MHVDSYSPPGMPCDRNRRGTFHYVCLAWAARTIVSGHGIRPARLSKRAKQHHRRPIGEPRIMSPLRRRASELPQADSGRARASAQDEMPRKCGPQGCLIGISKYLPTEAGNSSLAFAQTLECFCAVQRKLKSACGNARSVDGVNTL